MMRKRRTVEPNGPNGTGQPWALTLKRAADAEIVIGLRDRGRKADRIQHADDVAPARAGADPVDPPFACRVRSRPPRMTRRCRCAAGFARPWNAGRRRTRSGRPSVAASPSVARNSRSSLASSREVRMACREIGVSLSRLASSSMKGADGRAPRPPPARGRRTARPRARRCRRENGGGRRTLDLRDSTRAGSIA